jgi:DMSO/TMAO reductase YedYZ molybdopterin-dependent catalytic subunit
MSVKWVIAVLVIFAVAVIYILDISSSPQITPGTQMTQLAPLEIRSYQGERLSSSNDFRENSIKGPQRIDEAEYRLVVDGLVNRTVSYKYHEVLDHYPHYSKVVTLFCVEGWDVTILWEGILVRDILNDAGIDPRATTVILYAHDGYSTSLPLNDLFEHDIIMAYNMNNVTLPAERGFPFQLVAEDKWGYKWIKWIERIELSDNAQYRGYWEQRGYSNNGDLNRSFFG